MTAYESSTQSYLTDIGRHPLLTPEQELLLGRQVRSMMLLKGELTEGQKLTAKQRHLLHVGEKARTRMIQSNLRLVVSIAKRYAPRIKHLSMLDLVQEGSMGLVRGVEMYDPARGYRFSTYAYWWIKQAISRAITLRENVIRMPYSLAEKLPIIRRTAERLTRSLKREPTRTELAAALGIDEDELATMLIRTSAHASLEGTAGEGNTSLIDLLVDPTAPDAYDFIEEDYKYLDYAISQLTDKEQFVVRHRHGLQGGKALAFYKIGELMGISRQAVQQIEDRSMRRLRFFLSRAKHLGNAEFVANVVSNLDKNPEVVGRAVSTHKNNRL